MDRKDADSPGDSPHLPETAQALSRQPSQGWSFVGWSVFGATLCWLSQPPLGWSWLAWLALVPWIHLANRPHWSRRELVGFYLIACGYWALTMQGIRHAHPAMYATWLLFAIYLAFYSLAFVWLVRQGQLESSYRRLRWLIVPVIGTGLECFRNYFLTGISAVMLGHTQAEQTYLIQIADLFGTYGVTFLVLLVNATVYELIGGTCRRSQQLAVATTVLALAGSLGYGYWRLSQTQNFESTSATIAVIGQDQESIFIQDAEREQRIFASYVTQSLQAAASARDSARQLDAIIWPESMFTGGLPWMIREPNAPAPAQADDAELAAMIIEYRDQFQQRAKQIQQAIATTTGQTSLPHLVVGCSVVKYEPPPAVYSGVVHVNDTGQVNDWYGKTHLVMFGEYIPLIDYLPFIQSWVPPGMGVTPGAGPAVFDVNGLALSPTVCIETAVERVIPRQLALLQRTASLPDVIINVTNDRWFDHSAVVEHHLRCARFVAIACRRPVLIAANGGPTVWIDSSGRIIERLENDANGFLLARPTIDSRVSPYLSLGDWPARICMLVTFVWMVRLYWRRRNSQCAHPL